MRFKAAPEYPSTASATDPDDHAAAEDNETPGDLEDDVPHSEFAPYDLAALGERYTDDWLQTASTPESLDRSLRRLDEQARVSIDEQGVNTLFLALGMVHYTEALQSDIILRAPLVLLPVALVRKSARSGYVVRVGDDDPMVNPALAEHLRRDHGVALPDLPDSSAIADEYDLQ